MHQQVQGLFRAVITAAATRFGECRTVDQNLYILFRILFVNLGFRILFAWFGVQFTLTDPHCGQKWFIWFRITSMFENIKINLLDCQSKFIVWFWNSTSVEISLFWIIYICWVGMILAPHSTLAGTPSEKLERKIEIFRIIKLS